MEVVVVVVVVAGRRYRGRALLVVLAALDDGDELHVVELASLDGRLLPHLLDLWAEQRVGVGQQRASV